MEGNRSPDPREEGRTSGIHGRSRFVAFTRPSHRTRQQRGPTAAARPHSVLGRTERQRGRRALEAPDPPPQSRESRANVLSLPLADHHAREGAGASTRQSDDPLSFHQRSIRRHKKPKIPFPTVAGRGSGAPAQSPPVNRGRHPVHGKPTTAEGRREPCRVSHARPWVTR